MPAPPPPVPSRTPRELLFGTLAGRIFLAAAAIRLLISIIDRVAGAPPALSALGTLASVILIVTAAVFIIRGFVVMRRQLLWPVRRKLIVSYLFIGFVPALLLVVFFLFGGQVVFNSVTSYLFKSGYERYLLNAEQIAVATANDVARDPARAAQVMSSKIVNLTADNPGLSIAIVPLTESAPVRAGRAGPWRHADPPPAPFPDWLRRQNRFAGNVVCRLAEAQDTLIARAVRVPEGAAPSFAAIVDIPLGQSIADKLREDIKVTPVGVSAGVARGPGDRIIEPRPCLATAEPGLVGEEVPTMPFRYDRSIAFFDYIDWDTGQSGQVSVGLRVRLRQLYREVSEGQRVRVGNTELGELMWLLVIVVAVLFVIIQIAALVMGLALARSITTAVHELFVGTERVRFGDFTHRIHVQSRDQLGQLSDSFNQMSTSIEHLLQQAAEKRRMEEELRIAREIQMSLLPSGPLDMPGVSMTALCVPAREVGGDYYDFFKLSEHRFSVLIADVSGKGTSAALYMAELKGLLLSLSSIYQSPRQLLIEVNRILSDQLDTRSFITMTYAVIDMEARTLVFARAGHTPFVYLPGAAEPGAAPGSLRTAQVLIPDGMVLGLRVPNIERLFPHHLVEHTINLKPGDVLALYTDGITEAMNGAGDLFGEPRLSHIIEQHAHLDVAELRERIVRDVEAFAGAEDQHDDLTMILMKIEEPGTRLPAIHTEGIVDL